MNIKEFNKNISILGELFKNDHIAKNWLQISIEMGCCTNAQPISYLFFKVNNLRLKRERRNWVDSTILKDKLEGWHYPTSRAQK